MATPYIPYSGPTVTRADARSAGLKTFFVGDPCLYGHVSERYLAGACIQCVRDRAKAWKSANPDKVRASARKYDRAHPDAHKKWKLTNPEKARESRKKTYWKNPEAVREASRKWAKKNAQHILAYRKANVDATAKRTKEWAAANPEKVREKAKRWAAENPEGSRARTLNYRGRKVAADGSHTAEDLKALYVSQCGNCAYCQINLNGSYHADHIMPLSRGGSNWIANIQLTCAKCNLSKGDIDPIEFVRRLKLKAA